jgi:hypothetical protein
MDKHVFVADCDLGKGLFASREFLPGERILILSGKRIGLADAIAKGDRESDAMQVGPTEYLDLEAPGVYTNHSCDPNAGIVHDNQLVALRLIRRSEEIRFDYSTTMDEDRWTMACDCRSPHCRRVVEDFDQLPDHVQSRYLSLGIVQAFIARQRLGVDSPKSVAGLASSGS